MSIEYKEVVQRLIGPIHPVGETCADDARFENLKAMCKLVDDLVVEIDKVAYENINAPEFSRKRAADYASKFMTDTLGIAD